MLPQKFQSCPKFWNQNSTRKDFITNFSSRGVCSCKIDELLLLLETNSSTSYSPDSRNMSRECLKS